MHASTLLKPLRFAAVSALAAVTTQAAPSLAAEVQDDVHFTRAGGPRVEFRVTPQGPAATQLAARMTRYARG